MSKRALTAAAVDKLKPPATGQADHFDGGYPGLALRVSAGGRKTWTYFYRHRGKQRRLGLGVYPATGLAEAREAWRTARATVATGRDPASEKTEAKRRQPDTVRAVGAQFIAKWCRPRNRTADEVVRLLERHVYPALGERDITTVTRRDILDLLDAVPGTIQPNRVLAAVRRMFSWATERDLLEASPVASVRAPAAEISRDRVLTAPELRAFWLAANDLAPVFRDVFRMLVLTGQRRDEVASAPWKEFDLEAATWLLPAERTKNARSHVVPLAPAVTDLLRALPSRGRSTLLFPAEFVRVPSADGAARPASGFSAAKRRLDSAMLQRLQETDPEATLPAWRLHDLRRTCATGLAGLGVAPHVVEHLLNHISGTRAGVAGTYNRFGYPAERRTAAETWARHVLDLVEGRRSNVVPLVAR